MGFSFLELMIAISIISAILIMLISHNGYRSRSEQILFVAETQNIKSSLTKFRDKYHYYPGDFPYAKQWWGYNKNGDGDNLVSDDSESLFAWRHLELSQLIALKFLQNDQLKYAKISKNMIRSSYNECGYQLLADSKLNNANYVFPARKNFLRIAKGKSYGNLSRSCLKSLDAFELDSKIDDGKPLSGKIYADTGHEYYGVNKKDLCICDKDEGLSYCKTTEKNICFLQMDI